MAATASLQVTPSFVVFDFLKREASINYKDFALHLFNRDAKLGRVPLLNRLEDRTFMSRQVVRLAPGEMSLKMFDDFSQTAAYAWNELKCNCLAGNGTAEEKTLAAYEKLVDKAVPELKNALDAFNLKDMSFMNVVIAIANLSQLTLSTKGSLIMLLFIASGCTGDVSFAIDKTIEQMNKKGAVMRTAQLEDAAKFEPVNVPPERQGLTLFRIRNGIMVTPGFELFEGEEGNEIGLLPSGTHAIADVEKTVSRRHLRIWKREDGTWLAQGLNSKNGTVKIEAGTENQVVIEYPRDFAEGQRSCAVEIEPGDHLILGQDTEFIVCRTLRG